MKSCKQLPRLHLEAFWEGTTVLFFHLPPSVCLVHPVPAQAQRLPRLQPEPSAVGTLRILFSSPPLGPPTKEGLSECLAFPTGTQNYFGLDCISSSHP